MPEALTLISQVVISQDQWQDLGQHLAKKAGVLVLILVIAVVVQLMLHRLIDRLVSRAEEGVLLPARHTNAKLGRSSNEPTPGSTRRVQRAKTVGTLLKSIVSGLVIAIAITMMLAELGLDIAPILASAGILGVALGFGSQTLVKDYLSGIFMIFEDQYGVGDVVDLGEASGTVEAVSLRVTRLRDTNGTVWYVRNGEIIRVGNMSQNWARTVLDVQISSREDISHVRSVLTDVIEDMWRDDDYEGVIIEEPEIWGIEAITPDAITLRVTLKTAPMEQWRVARVLRERIKSRFDHEGIQAPYPTSYVMNQTPASTSADGEAAEQ